MNLAVLRSCNVVVNELSCKRLLTKKGKILMAKYEDLITDASRYALLNDELVCNTYFSPTLITNDSKNGIKVFSEIEAELQKLIKHGGTFWFSVAFITYGGVNSLLGILNELEINNIQGQILTSDYLNFSEPRALEALKSFSNLEVRVDESNFHIKGYMFKGLETSTFFVGSSNLTNQALSTNKEWNIRLTGVESGALLKSLDEYYYALWNTAVVVDDYWLEKYSEVYKKRNSKLHEIKIIDFDNKVYQPNSMQLEALKSLAELRINGESKAILISATGTGKTILAAFDVKAYKPKRLLFLAHREQLLLQAEESFIEVMKYAPEESGILSGTQKNYDKQYLFSTMNMMAKEEVQMKFEPDSFDYIIIDEAHRSASNSYQSILNYFKPKFLFGMTATPNRTDAKEIISQFDYNIALRISLQNAMEEDLLCPFHYFGISEIYIDGELLSDKEDFSKYLSIDQRVNNIIQKIEFYGYSGDRVKGLIFCSRVEEAKDLSDKFNHRGYKTLSLSSENSNEMRLSAIQRLEKENKIDDYLDYIFTVDLFNEGIDIPCVNQIVLLRPTKSAIIFMQQLGRGLRKYPDKEFVVVLDFIGNYDVNYNIPMALSGDRTCNKEVIRKTVTDGTRFLAGNSTIYFDEIAKKQIYKSIDNSKIGGITDIKEAYETLKNEIGHVPTFTEFNRSSNVEMIKIFDIVGSYYTLVKKCEKQNFFFNLEEPELQSLDYLSKRVGKGKDYNLLALLEYLVSDSEEFPPIDSLSLETCYKILTHSFSSLGKPTKKVMDKHNACIFATKDADKIVRSNQLENYLNNDDFKKAILELIKFAKNRHISKYKNIYRESKMTLFETYSYCEVCSALNWDSDQSATIGGYKYDSKTNTFPVFINYNKDEAAISYDDVFLNGDTFQALSKTNAPIGGKNWESIYKSKENGTKMYLFVRKQKNISNSKDFFFLGEISPIGEAKKETLENGKNAFRIIYKLQTSVRKDIYEYLTLAD
ncbi:MAG: DUF3427 domain-containing protein [Spirochaetaceae bacterium]|nr:DUF3427 domain-containing protein [Spirochaetaceae bacterium]